MLLILICQILATVLADIIRRDGFSTGRSSEHGLQIEANVLVIDSLTLSWVYYQG
jgi:hypothetical protein